jgi:hypothetical protein
MKVVDQLPQLLNPIFLLLQIRDVLLAEFFHKRGRQLGIGLYSETGNGELRSEVVELRQEEFIFVEQAILKSGDVLLSGSQKFRDLAMRSLNYKNIVIFY